MKRLLIVTLLTLGITFPLNIFSQNNLPSKEERIYSRRTSSMEFFLACIFMIISQCDNLLLLLFGSSNNCQPSLFTHIAGSRRQY